MHLSLIHISLGHLRRLYHHDVVGQAGIHRQRDAVAGDGRGGAEVGDIGLGVDAGVGAARPGELHRVANHGGQGLFQGLDVYKRQGKDLVLENVVLLHLENSEIYVPVNSMEPDVMSADTMGEVLVDRKLTDGTEVVCYWMPDSEYTKYWAIRQGDSLLRFCVCLLYTSRCV